MGKALTGEAIGPVKIKIKIELGWSGGRTMYTYVHLQDIAIVQDHRAIPLPDDELIRRFKMDDPDLKSYIGSLVFETIREMVMAPDEIKRTKDEATQPRQAAPSGEPVRST